MAYTRYCFGYDSLKMKCAKQSWDNIFYLQNDSGLVDHLQKC